MRSFGGSDTIRRALGAPSRESPEARAALARLVGLKSDRLGAFADGHERLATRDLKALAQAIWPDGLAYDGRYDALVVVKDRRRSRPRSAHMPAP